jgi:hypothetical protein
MKGSYTTFHYYLFFILEKNNSHSITRLFSKVVMVVCKVFVTFLFLEASPLKEGCSPGKKKRKRKGREKKNLTKKQVERIAFPFPSLHVKSYSASLLVTMALGKST